MKNHGPAGGFMVAIDAQVIRKTAKIRIALTNKC
jgi:hypothetical protein